MSLQTSLDTFFKHRGSLRVPQAKDMNTEKKSSKRNLSLTRSSLPNESVKKLDQQVNEEEVICLSSSSEESFTPPKQQLHNDAPLFRNSSESTLSQDKTPVKEHNIQRKINSEKKAKKRNLSLTRSSHPSKSPKILSQQESEFKSEGDVCLPSSIEDLLTPPEQKYKPQEKTQDKLLNIQGSLDSPDSSADSSSTIVYSLSLNKSQQSPITPLKTPKTPKSGSQFFSPTKKRIVSKKNAAKRNLDFQFQNNKHSDTEDEKLNKVMIAKYQDDKTLSLLAIVEQYLRADELKKLLKDDSQALLSSFVHLEESSMRVVCRLFWRQPGWYRAEQLEQIASGKMKSPVIHEMSKLVDNGWITSGQSGDASNMDFDDYVKLLKRPELLDICKDLKLKMQSKQDAVDALKKFCQSSAITNYFTGKMGNNRSRVLNMFISARLMAIGSPPITLGPKHKTGEMWVLAPLPTPSGIKALKVKTGQCYKLSDLARSTLHKLYILMYMGMDYTIIREKRLELILLHDKIKKETYPIDKLMVVDNASVVFQSRDDFYRYLEAQQLYEKYIESTDTQEQCDIVLQAYKLYKEIDEDDMTCYKSLSPWLRRYTPASIYVKLLENGVQDLKKAKSEKQYTIAVQILDSLISQREFRQHHKYKWYAEKALILHKHLDRTEQAVHTLLEGFKADLSEEAKDVLRPRAKQIANQRNVVLNDELRQALRGHVEQEYILESNLPADHVYKQPMDNHNQRGKLKFEARLEQGRSIMSAEDYCVVHYTHSGEFTHGEHWEGRVVVTMFFLLFWDIIYTKPEGIPGIFMSHYQRHPLDLYSESFYINRKTVIDERIKLLEESADEAVVGMMQHRWDERPEYEVSEICRSMGWPTVASVAGCLGARSLAAICRRLARNYGYTHSGFPDLTLWNVHTKQYWVEWKAKTKSKGADIRRNALKTGGGPNKLTPLNEFEQRILELIGRVCVEGLPGVRIPFPVPSENTTPGSTKASQSYSEPSTSQAYSQLTISQTTGSPLPDTDCPMEEEWLEDDDLDLEKLSTQPPPSQPPSSQPPSSQPLPLPTSVLPTFRHSTPVLPTSPLPPRSSPTQPAPPRQPQSSPPRDQQSPSPQRPLSSAQLYQPLQRPRSRQRLIRNRDVPQWARSLEERRLAIEEMHARALEALSATLERRLANIEDRLREISDKLDK